MRMLVEMQDWILQQGGNRAEATARMQGLVFHHVMVPVALGLGENEHCPEVHGVFPCNAVGSRGLADG